MNDPPRLRELLDPVTARFGMDGASAAGAIWSRWADIVGDSVAQHAEPTSLREGVLRVRADSPAWATEISYLGDGIRQRCNEIAARSLVREVRVWTSNAPVARRQAHRPQPADQGEHVRDMPAPSDAMGALERARRAWRKRFARGPEQARRRPPGNG